MVGMAQTIPCGICTCAPGVRNELKKGRNPGVSYSVPDNGGGIRAPQSSPTKAAVDSVFHSIGCSSEPTRIRDM
jgi:hypothetical protein